MEDVGGGGAVAVLMPPRPHLLVTLRVFRFSPPPWSCCCPGAGKELPVVPCAPGGRLIPAWLLRPPPLPIPDMASIACAGAWGFSYGVILKAVVGSATPLAPP